MVNVELKQGDCLELMKDIPDGSVDLVLTDPPYGTTACKWDSVIPFEPMWEQLNRIIKPNGAICLFGSEPFSSALRMSNIKCFKYDWVWDKHNTNGFLNAKKRPLKRHENISVFSVGTPAYIPQMEERGKPRQKGSYNKKKGNGDMVYGRFNNVSSVNNLYYPTDIISFSNAKQKGKVHPTQKPVALYEWLLNNYAKQGDRILDTHLGSGSSRIAAYNLGFDFVGCEIDKEYFDKQEERFARHTAQTSLFVDVFDEQSLL